MGDLFLRKSRELSDLEVTNIKRQYSDLFLKQVVAVAKEMQFNYPEVGFLDLVQAGDVGLFNAVEAFDPSDAIRQAIRSAFPEDT